MVQGDAVRKLVTALALFCGIATAVVTVGGGLTLLAIRDSGEQASGGLVAVGGLAALALLLVLAFAPSRLFPPRWQNAGLIGAGLLAALPTAVLAFAILWFVKLPFGSPVPLLDWPLLGVGIVLLLGAGSIAALGYWRSQDGRPIAGVLPRGAAPQERQFSSEEEGEVPVIHMQQIRNAQQQLREVFEKELRSQGDEPDDEVRVRRV